MLVTYKHVTVDGCVEDKERYGRVNPCRMKLEGKWYEPEMLLVVGIELVVAEGRERQNCRTTFAVNLNGWNNLPHPDGGSCRVQDSAGNPMYSFWK